MKITTKTTNYALGVAVLSFIITLVNSLISITAIQVSKTFDSVEQLVSSALDFFLFFFLSCFLKNVREKKRIVITLRIYIFLIPLTLILFKVFRRTDNIGAILPYAKVYVVILLLIFCYLLIQIFTVKNQSLKIPFKLWAISWIICKGIKLPLDLILIYQHIGLTLFRYASLLELLPTSAVIFIFYKISIYLNHEQLVFKQAALDTDEPA